MLELVQFPWSPYCLVIRRILEYSGTPFKAINIPTSDRSLIWKLTKKRYYQAPIVKDGRNVLFETDENSQVIAKYLESKLNLSLFPRTWDGIQKILWRFIENEVEGYTFRLNDAYFHEFVPPAEQWAYVRHKERKFGKGCLDQWFQQQKQLVAELNEKLVPFEQMLAEHTFLLDNQPRFVDFDLWGMLANFLFSGHYKLPTAHPRLKGWYERVGKAKFVKSSREKLHS
jgi:glutathione S-transferase